MDGGRLFRRPKLTLSCSAEGKEGSLLYILFPIHIFKSQEVGIKLAGK
jgi:hypothetical protein